MKCTRFPLQYRQKSTFIKEGESFEQFLLVVDLGLDNGELHAHIDKPGHVEMPIAVGVHRSHQPLDVLLAGEQTRRPDQLCYLIEMIIKEIYLLGTDLTGTFLVEYLEDLLEFLTGYLLAHMG